MGELSEPDDVDFFVGDVEPDPEAAFETAQAIEEYKRRPEYREEAERAKQILADLGIHVPDYGLEDAQKLLDHWQRCVADLRKGDYSAIRKSNVDPENLGASSGLPSEIRK